MRTVLTLGLCAALLSAAGAAETPHTITVSAQSEVRVAPDEAIIAFSVATQDMSMFTAKRENDALTTVIFKGIREAGIAADHFKVTGLDIGPRYEGPYSNRRFLGYGVTRSFELRTDDFSKIDPIIADLVQAGGEKTTIDRLKLQVRDQRAHQVEARRLAVEYAKEKASHLADLNGMRLGAAITIKEGVEYNADAVGFGGMGGAMSAADSAAAPHVATAPESRPSPNRSSIYFVSAEQEADSGEQSKDQPEGRDLLLSAGQVSLNAVVTIQFELVPDK